MDPQASRASTTGWDEFSRSPESTIPLLQEVQKEDGYISEESLDRVAAHAHAPLSAIYGVATFFSQFRLARPGLHMIRVCEGTACHVLGANDIMDALQELLGVQVGETTPDGIFTLESVRCLGCCSLSPAVMIDDETYGRVSRKGIAKILAKYREAAR